MFRENTPSLCSLTEQSVYHEKKKTTRSLQRLQDPAGKPVASSRTGNPEYRGHWEERKRPEGCTVCLAYEIAEYEEVLHERYLCIVGVVESTEL